MEFVSLHTHTTFSYGDGYGTVLQHVSRVAKLGMGALGLTEHGNCSSWVQLEIACAAKGIKPIYGCEIYTAPPDQKRKCHMILLAMDSEGLQNLNRIITESWKTLGTTSKSRFPTVHWPILKENNAGLIALSGCSDSFMSCTLLGGKSYGDPRLELRNGDIQRGIKVAQLYAKVFGDRYYLEVQRFPDLKRTCVLNQTLEKISLATGISMAATADVHYPHPRQNAIQRILHAAHQGSSVEAKDAEWEYDVILSYPLSDEEITKDLVATGISEYNSKVAIFNTSRIADRCNVVLPKVEPMKYVVGERDWEPWT